MRRLIGLVLGGLILTGIVSIQTPAVAQQIPIEVDSVVTVQTISPQSITRAVALTRTQRIELVVRYALAQKGDDYRFGASGPYAFDCSGLVMMAYRKIGIYLPHYSGAMLSRGWRVSKANLRRGDIIWPHRGHVQLYLGNGYVVEASSSRDAIVVRKMWGFWTARRLI